MISSGEQALAVTASWPTVNAPLLPLSCLTDPLYVLQPAAPLTLSPLISSVSAVPGRGGVAPPSCAFLALRFQWLPSSPAAVAEPPQATSSGMAATRKS